MAPPKPASPAPATKAAAKGAQGNILTKKIGPLPGWAWAVIGLGGLYLWKKHQAAGAAASNTATAQPSLPISDQTAPSGYGYQGPGGSSGGGPIPTGAMAATSRGHSGVRGVNPGGVEIPAIQPLNPATAASEVVGTSANNAPNATAAANNTAAVGAYTNSTGGNANVLNAYEAYAATLPAGGLAPGQAMSPQSQAALAAYNQAVAASK